MADNILDTYFVKIAALPDAKSFAKAAHLLRGTELSIQGVAKSAAKSMLAFETASVSAFAAIGVGLIALADKTAMTDQSYRLMGMRMLMTKDSARSMQMALDELGATIDEVAFDPELNSRFQYLYEQNVRLGKQLGTNFDVVQRNIRDVRMEYKRLGTELEFLSYAVVSKLFSKLGFGNEDLLNKLHNLNEWFTEKLPQIAEFVSKQFVPIWNDANIVLKDFGQLAEMAAGTFQLFTGELMDDDALKNTNVSVKSLTETFQDWVDWITKATLGLQFLGKIVAHTFDAAGYFAEEMRALKNGDMKTFREFRAKQHAESDAGLDDLKALLTGRADQVADGSAIREYFESKDSGLMHSHNAPTNMAQLIDVAAQKYNLNPELLAAITHQEDPSHDPGAISPKGAMGLMQLMPGTAKQMGVSNPFNPAQNMDAGAHYFSDLLKRYNYNVPLALAAYNAGPGNVDRAGGIPQNNETPNYVSRILRQFSELDSASKAQGGKVIVDTVNINVPHALPEGQWSQFVRDSFKDQTDKATRNTMAQTAGGAYY